MACSPVTWGRMHAAAMRSASSMPSPVRALLSSLSPKCSRMGSYLHEGASLDMYPMIAIPYNPYAPKPYSRPARYPNDKNGKDLVI